MLATPLAPPDKKKKNRTLSDDGESANEGKGCNHNYDEGRSLEDSTEEKKDGKKTSKWRFKYCHPETGCCLSKDPEYHLNKVHTLKSKK